MHSIAFKSAKEYTFNNDLQDSVNFEDSGISEDMKDSSKYAPEMKYIDTEICQNEILELPSDGRKGNMKKMAPEERIPGNRHILTSEEYMEKLSTLQQLREEEKLFKIAIAYEKLRKEQPVLLDADLLHQKIANYQRLLQEAKNRHKMRNVMCLNLQLTNTLQRIVGKGTPVYKQNSFSDSQKKCIKDSLRKKKELSRKINVKRKAIAEIDKDVSKLEKAALTNNQKKSKLAVDCNLGCTSIEKDSLDELERLEENSKRVIKRVRLLSQMVQSLIAETGLSEMMGGCRKSDQEPFQRKG